MTRSLRSILLATVGLAIAGLPTLAAPRSRTTTVLIALKDGRTVEGELVSGALRFQVNATERSLKPGDVLSYHSAEPASAHEAERITAGLAAVQGTDRAARDAAVAELTAIGLPVMSPLLQAYKDVDAREPRPLYRLFARIMPGHADMADRGVGLIRQPGGMALRGSARPVDLTVKPADGRDVRIAMSAVRRLAVRQEQIDRTFDIHSLAHSTQIEYLDSGVSLTSDSHLTADATGYVRLSFGVDGWSSDPDGLKVPGPNYKSNLFEGHPFGALVGRVAAQTRPWMVGRHVEKTGLPAGELYLAINDNPHWQNNIGNFRVKLSATRAYDLGDPQ